MEATGSPKAARILAEFACWLPKFKKILPHDYDRMLRTIARYEAQGMDRARAEAEAFSAKRPGKGGLTMGKPTGFLEYAAGETPASPRRSG